MEAARARFSFPDTQKKSTDKKGRGFYIPLGLRILLNAPTQSPSRAWVTQLLQHMLPRAAG